MPVIRKSMLPPELLERFKRFGPCLQKNDEVWWLRGRQVRLGIVSEVENGAVSVKKSDGSVVWLDPSSTLIFAQGLSKLKANKKFISGQFSHPDNTV